MPVLDSSKVAREVQAVLMGVPEVAAAYLFGSVARGTAREDSDLDLGIVYGRELAGEHDRLVPELAVRLAKATGFDRIDVVDLAAQGPMFAHHVLCEGKLVYEADRVRRIDFESDTMRDAFDFMPTYRIATANKVAALRQWLGERYGV